MATITNTNLPEDFIEKVLALLRDGGAPSCDIHDAILAVLHRPMTLDEKLAMVDHAAANSPGVMLDRDLVGRIGRGGIV